MEESTMGHKRCLIVVSSQTEKIKRSPADPGEE
jgi:hypothetical protein